MTLRCRDLVGAAIVLVLACSPVTAQEWPNRPVQLVVGFAAGGGTDVVARIFAQSLQERLGKPVVVDNKPGAGGMIAAGQVAKATPDGRTLYLVNNGHVITGVMQKSLPYDTVKSFEPVSLLATAGLVIVVHPKFPADNLKDLIARAKAEPGKLNFASVGVGSTQHFSGELFKQSAGVDMLHVPFRGSPAAITAVIGREIEVLFETIQAVLGQVQSGDLKALAVTGRERFPGFPEVPTVSEAAGLTDYDTTTWYGLVAPVGTPPAVIEKLNKTLAEIAKEPAVQERLAKAGAVARTSNPEAFGQHMTNELVRWEKVRDSARIEKQ
ncbi:tripartite tricarboxylate transporter substrate binding protein [Bradyrhizobium prioriisuperbiae]|uniref:Bug family tripartite tricarboxylate transporter substrate binding protein n=1 Tax=Bradyrhizobium prioriisuperbiae TaxID=2854389 RepID=UPI0028E78AA7|nr:tripartite tricarboxylate transporter substrate binding protein [Bradyrhizobium prioritasuperba]